jgi:sulfur carrier protein
MEDFMQVSINGLAEQFPDNLTVHGILTIKGIQENTVIVFLNDEVVGRTFWAKTLLHSEDRIEIIRIVGGG